MCIYHLYENNKNLLSAEETLFPGKAKSNRKALLYVAAIECKIFEELQGYIVTTLNKR